MAKFFSSLALILVILGVGAGLYFSLIDPFSSRFIQVRVGDLMQGSLLPEELKDAHYLLLPRNGGGVYHQSELSFDDYYLNGSLVVDLAVASTAQARLLHNVVTDTHDVRVNQTTVLSSSDIKRHLAISQDGTRVTVSIRRPEGYITDPAGWSVGIFDANTGESWEVEAFAAVFLEKDKIVAFREDGIYEVNYLSGEERLLLESPAIVIHESIAQSKDGTKVAWTTLNGDAYVFDVLKDSELPMMQVANFSGVTGSISVTNENMYELRESENEGTEIFIYPLYTNEAPRMVRSVPSILALKKMIP